MYRSRGSCVTGSPLTTANGISTCSGETCAGVARSGLDTTILRSGFTNSSLPSSHRRAGSPYRSLRSQMHGAAHLIERVARRGARLLPTFDQDLPHPLGIFLEFLRALAHAGDLLDDALDQRLLALETADARGTAAVIHPL